MHRLSRTRAAAARSLFRRMAFLLQTACYRAYEKCYADYRVSAFLSPADVASLAKRANACVTTMGADCLEEPDPLPAEPKVLFFGNLSYPPNEDSIRQFVERAWLLIQRRRPTTRLLVAGARPSRSLVSFLTSQPNVEVIPSPPDLRACVPRARIVIAPLTWGAGQKTKLLDSMALCRPTICSRHALEGSEFEPGKHVHLCATWTEWADSVVRLLDDDSELERLRLAGYEFVKKRYPWSRAASELLRMYDICRDRR